MKDMAMSFAQDMLDGRSPRWLSMLGTSGAGKTMLAKIIARLYRETFDGRINWDSSRSSQSEDMPYGAIQRYHGGFINWGNAINNRMLKGQYGFLEDMGEFDFFAIDDIISEYEKHRSLSASKLYGVMESRLKRWTVITANASLKQIGELLDPRISSRMIRGGSVVLDVDVPDWNLRRSAA